ncbi:LOW QUALITY PROTEIN: DNA-binding response regulator [Bacillus sp. JCM 19046]|nr:LOW QUALITY PROTEIN: DNA-binding response regulator [Bacillus sp. JCM 19046]
MERYSVLVVDDEKEIREAIEIYLNNEEIDVIHASDGLEAIQVLQEKTVHLILLDIMMPKLDGIKLRKSEKSKTIPIIMLSAKSEDMDKIFGLQVGADDYVTKPFNPLELIARVKSQLRRYVKLGRYQGAEDQLTLRGLTLDKGAKEVRVDDQLIKLTPIEFRIVELLLTNVGRSIQLKTFMSGFGTNRAIKTENTVAVHIRRIREKIEIDPKNPRYLKVVWGIGYKMEK